MARATASSSSEAASFLKPNAFAQHAVRCEPAAHAVDPPPGRVDEEHRNTSRAAFAREADGDLAAQAARSPRDHDHVVSQFARSLLVM
jgi:hypothetical protein